MQGVPMQQVQDPNRQAYGGYAAGGYAQAQYGFPATFYGAGYPQGYGQFQQPMGFRGGRGGRGGYGQQGAYGRGGYGGGFPQQQMGFQSGFGGRGGMMFGMRARRKKPFVGGSLETQRQWEQQTLCCFFVQGLCKFGEGCRYSHDDDGVRPCQFGSQCRVGHSNRGEPPTAANQPATTAPAESASS